MRKWIGGFCILLGIACLAGAIGFVMYNRWEADNAEQVSQSMLEDVQQAIVSAKPTLPAPDIPEETQGSTPTEEAPVEMPTEMPTVQVDGYDCIGILSIPALGVELPVLTDWSYEKLKKAPCHYYGSYNESDFVIAAHNYNAHFGRLSQLQPGDLVVFTDVSGVAHYYEAVLVETLPKEATKEMIASGFDLSLYTCTPGGANRVTLRCNRK